MNKSQSLLTRHLGLGVAVATILIIALALVLWDSDYPISSMGIIPIILLVGGIIGGYFSYVLNRRVALARTRYGVSTFGVGLGLILCSGPFLLVFGILFYSVTPWPSPQPYVEEGIEQSEGPTGSYGFARIQVYTADKPLADIRTYYEIEMKAHCSSEPELVELHPAMTYATPNRWKIDELQNYVEDEACVVLECSIQRWSLAQSFEVLVCAESNTRTIVSQIDIWED